MSKPKTTFHAFCQLPAASTFHYPKALEFRTTTSKLWNSAPPPAALPNAFKSPLLWLPPATGSFNTCTEGRMYCLQPAPSRSLQVLNLKLSKLLDLHRNSLFSFSLISSFFRLTCGRLLRIYRTSRRQKSLVRLLACGSIDRKIFRDRFTLENKRPV